MQIQLSKYIVELKDELSWYEQNEIEAEMISGSQMNQETKAIVMNGQGMFEAKIKLLERLITSIKEGDNTIVCSRDWVKGLNQEDGNKLYAAVEKITAKKA
jgi:hypothetical protein